LIRHGRTRSNYSDFLKRHFRLSKIGKTVVKAVPYSVK
jgi:hypothetical protein